MDIDASLRSAVNLLHESELALVDAEATGIVSVDLLRERSSRAAEVVRLNKELMKQRDVPSARPSLTFLGESVVGRSRTLASQSGDVAAEVRASADPVASGASEEVVMRVPVSLVGGAQAEETIQGTRIEARQVVTHSVECRDGSFSRLGTTGYRRPRGQDGAWTAEVSIGHVRKGPRVVMDPRRGVAHSRTLETNSGLQVVNSLGRELASLRVPDGKREINAHCEKFHCRGDGMFDGEVGVSGGLGAGGNMTVEGSAVVGGGLEVEQAVMVGQGASVGGGLYVAGHTVVRGDTSLGGRLSVQDNIVGGSELHVGGDALVQGRASISGRVDIGSNVDVSGTIRATGDVRAGSVFTASDMRMKSDVVDINPEEALRLVEQLKPVRFKFKNDSVRTHVGFIAQQVHKVLPEVVHGHGGEVLSVQYGNVSAVTVGAIQELVRMISVLTKEVQELKQGTSK